MRRMWAAALTAAVVVALAAPRATHARQEAPATAPRSGDAPAQRDPGRGRTVGTEVPELLDTLLDADTPRETRDEAARRLTSRQSDEAREALRQVVTSAGVSQEARVAALRALADDPNPSPRLLNDLLAVLDEGNDRLVAGAAEALAAYKRSPQVVEALSALARDGKRARPQREAAARALGRLPEQAAAAALVGIVTNREENPELVAVAADALIEMTGLGANGRDPGRWEQWWKQNGNLPPGEWARALLPARAAREDRVRRRAEDAIAAIARLLEIQYDETPNESRPRMLLRYLNDPSPEIRRVGAGIASRVSQLVDAAEQITEPVELRLVELTGDADPGVRLDAVRALENTPVDQELLLAVLLPQLRVETDANVRQAIARKLSRARVDQPAELGRILDELARLLDDASPGVVREAAVAINRLVTRAPAMLKQNPAVAGRIAARLRATMQRLAGQGGFQEARQECGRALAVFKDPQSRAFARELLSPRREPPAIRGVALIILGELGPPTADITLAVDNDPDPGVKLEGIRALSRTGSFESAGWLAPRLNDPDPKIRETAADTYRKLLSTAAPETLVIEADRRKANPALRVDILKVLLDKLTAAGNTREAAGVNQNIGSNYLRELNRPDLAVPYLRDALDQYRGAGFTLGATETLRKNLITAMLRSRQYTQLAAMGQQWIAGAPDEETAAIYRREIGVGMRNEAEQLLTAYKDQSGSKWQENLNHAAALIDAGLKMQPPLEDAVRKDLTQLETDVRNRAARAPGAR